jgi:predicted Zn-dependent peptidase
MVYKPLLRDNGFMPSYVHNACSTAAREIKEKLNDKRGYASERLIELMCEGEPFGISGDGYIEDFGDVNGQSLYSAYRTLLAEGAVELYIVGNISRGEAESYVSNHFEAVNPHVREVADFVTKEKQPIRYHTIRNDIAQSVLTIGIRTNSQSYPKLAVANEILGGSATSRLFNKVREKLGMCYYIGSQLYRYKGIIAVQAGIEQKNAEAVIEEVSRELNTLANKTADEKEIKKAKDSITARLVTAEDYPQRLIDLLLSFSVANEPYSVQRLIDDISGVESESIKEVLESAFIDTVLLMN